MLLLTNNPTENCGLRRTIRIDALVSLRKQPSFFAPGRVPSRETPLGSGAKKDGCVRRPCIGGSSIRKGGRVAAPVRSAHLHDLKMRSFLFHAADEERGFKYDELIIQRSSENERHTLINLCLVAVWSDPFQII